jgi:FAD/FMN-containing dehydrogenase
MRGLVNGIEAVLPDGAVFNGLVALKKDNRGYDLRQLLIGAEGTLGIVTAASLKLVPAIGSRSVAWAGLASPQAALRLLRMLESRTGESVESFELIPRVGLDLVLAHIEGTRAPLQGSHDWNVLIEATAPVGQDSPEAALGDALAAAIDEGLVEDATLSANEAQAEAMWRIRESMAEAERFAGPGPRHDISVAVDMMPDFVISAADAVRQRFPGTHIVAFGHLGDGNIHFNVSAPQSASADWMERESGEVTGFVHDLVTAAGGSISAEHGIGQTRLTELERLADPARLGALRAIKQALDPLGIMNPGKLVRVAEARAAP